MHTHPSFSSVRAEARVFQLPRTSRERGGCQSVYWMLSGSSGPAKLPKSCSPLLQNQYSTGTPHWGQGGSQGLEGDCGSLGQLQAVKALGENSLPPKCYSSNMTDALRRSLTK